MTELLTEGGFVMSNRSLMRELGCQCAVLLGELCSEHDYWEGRKSLDDGWFYSTVDHVAETIGMNRRAQESCIRTLVERGLLECSVRGFPKVRHFRIRKDAVAKFVSDKKEAETPVCTNVHPVGTKSQTECTKSQTGCTNVQTECTKIPSECTNVRSEGTKRAINKTNIIIQDNNTNKYTGVGAFKPSFEDILKMCERCGYTGINGDPKKFAEWFESSARQEDGTLFYKGEIKNWQSLSFMLRRAHTSGRQIAEERKSRPVNTPPRRESMDGGAFF